MHSLTPMRESEMVTISNEDVVDLLLEMKSFYEREAVERKNRSSG